MGVSTNRPELSGMSCPPLIWFYEELAFVISQRRMGIYKSAASRFLGITTPKKHSNKSSFS